MVREVSRYGHLIGFTHDRVLDIMPPDIAPTGRRIEVAVAVVCGFRDGKITREHIYWDQATVLVQAGLLEPAGLPVTGAEATTPRAERQPDPVFDGFLETMIDLVSGADGFPLLDGDACGLVQSMERESVVVAASHANLVNLSTMVTMGAAAALPTLDVLGRAVNGRVEARADARRQGFYFLHKLSEASQRR